MKIDPRDLLVLSTVNGIGPARLRSLVQYFSGTDGILECTASELTRIGGIDSRTAGGIAGFAKSSERFHAERSADRQLTKLSALGGRFITLWDTGYPSNLKRVYVPPPFLFVRGKGEVDVKNSIAIVGTRNPSAYGSAMAERFAESLSSAGFAVVSGLARGIDTIAHEQTLRGKRNTMAVLGSGIDITYPPENFPLAERIIAHGSLISEFPMGTQPDAVNFPRRNRIISGLTLGTLVVETGISGGAMITASIALEQNREVFAIPGPLTLESESGAHLLIKEGRAKLTESLGDILSELEPGMVQSLKNTTPEPSHQLTLFEERVYDVLTVEPTHVDCIADRSGISTADVLVELLKLELKGLVRQLPGKLFRRV